MTHPVLPQDATVVCAHCGASAVAGVPCPVCDIPVGVAAAEGVDGTPEGLPSGFVARAWHTGRLALVMAVAAFVGSLWLPLAGGVMVRNTRGEVMLDVWVKPIDYVLGTYPSLHGRMTAWLLPGAALFLLHLLRSRRAGSTMAAARPLVTTVSLAPLVSVVLPLLRLRRLGVDVRPGPALALVAVGVVLGLVAASRFGRDVPEAVKQRARDRGWETV